MEKRTRYFGLQLCFDGYGADKFILSSVDSVYRFLETMCGEIGMTPISPPFVVRYVPPQPYRQDEWGVSGVILIAESHVSCHTFPEKQFVTIDVYSCKFFDVEKAKNFIISYFKVTDFECVFSKRGSKYF